MRRTGARVTRSGFQLTVGTDAAERLARQGRVRVFAIEGDHASELEILGKPKIVD